MSMVCKECKNGEGTETEFNKILCDDCYTEYRVTLGHMFDLKDLYEVDDLLSNIKYI